MKVQPSRGNRQPTRQTNLQYRLRGLFTYLINSTGSAFIHSIPKSFPLPLYQDSRLRAQDKLILYFITSVDSTTQCTVPITALCIDLAVRRTLGSCWKHWKQILTIVSSYQYSCYLVGNILRLSYITRQSLDYGWRRGVRPQGEFIIIAVAAYILRWKLTHSHSMEVFLGIGQCKKESKKQHGWRLRCSLVVTVLHSMENHGDVQCSNRSHGDSPKTAWNSECQKLLVIQPQSWYWWLMTWCD